MKISAKAFFLFIFLVCQGYGPGLGFCEKIDRIAAIVNGDIITEEELNLFVRMATMDEGLGFKGLQPQEIRKKLLEQMIEDRILLQEAKRLEIKPDEKAMEDRIQEIKERAGGGPAFEQALVAHGISLAELREKIRNQMLIYLVVQKEIKTKIFVNPKEVTEFFEQNNDQFMTSESVVVESIFVEDAVSLEEVQKRLGAGEDFAGVERAFSKKSGLGRVLRGQLKKELEDAIFSLETGQRSAPVAFEGGYFIFLAQEKAPASRKTLEEVKEKIESHLEKVKTEKMLKEWLETLKEKAYISIRE